MDESTNKLERFFQALLAQYGPQHWWPGECPFEVMVGVVLTQNTNWSNVEKAIGNLKRAKMLSPAKIEALSHDRLAQLIRPAGYFNIKAKRLKNLIHWLCREHEGSLEGLADMPADQLRQELLAINGIGRESADSIILYALEKPTFVIDTYTYRVLVRHGCIGPESDYEEVKEYCQSHLLEDVKVYNEFHALLVAVGKNHCKPRPICSGCPLEGFEHHIESADGGD